MKQFIYTLLNRISLRMPAIVQATVIPVEAWVDGQRKR